MLLLIILSAIFSIIGIYYTVLITIIIKRTKNINIHIHHTGNLVNTVDPVTLKHESNIIQLDLTQIPYHVNITDPEFAKTKPVALTDREEITRENWKKEK